MDRVKPGSKMHVLSDANGLPLVVGVSSANTHDSEALKPMVEQKATIRPALLTSRSSAPISEG